ncbi:MAG: efflux RND transporter periplasmic adaptor subunit [Deltaproteobacteria bacterium]
MSFERRSSRNKKQWLWFFGFLAAFLILLIGLYIRMISVRSSAFEAENSKKLSPVRVQEPSSTEVWRTTSFLARIEGGQSIDVMANTGGWVQEREAVIGESVEKDQPLLILRDERKVLKLKEADARLKSARANLNELKRKYDQTLTLVEKGIVARDTLQSLSNQVSSEASNVDALEAAYNLMEWDVDHLVIRAPISGKVVDTVPDVGQEVKAGELVAKMVSTSNERVVAGLEPRWARVIKPGMTVNFSTTLNGRLEKTEGEIIGVSPDMDSASGTYKVEARLIKNEYNWWPGEIVNMEVPVELLTDVILVPRTAVLSDNREFFIFVYKQGKALKVPVSVTWVNENEGSIPSDMIPEGSKIIVEGHVGLAGGQLVRLMQ